MCDELMVCLWNSSQKQNPRCCPWASSGFWLLSFSHALWELGITAALWLNNLVFLIPLQIQFCVKLESPMGSFQPWSISWWCTTAGLALMQELKIPENCLKQLQLKFMQHWKFLFWELDVAVVLVWAGIWNDREGNIQVSVTGAALPFFAKEVTFVWGWNSGPVRLDKATFGVIKVTFFEAEHREAVHHLIKNRDEASSEAKKLH